MTTVSSIRRTARLGLAGAALLMAAGGASADEGGLGGFFASIFGARPQAAAPRIDPDYAPSAVAAPAHPRRARLRPLTVRLRTAKPRTVAAQASGKPGKGSIFEDRTLRRGDAVMTAQGVRIFAGSTSWPYTAEDFVGLDKAQELDRGTSKVLAQLDKLPRG